MKRSILVGVILALGLVLVGATNHFDAKDFKGQVDLTSDAAHQVKGTTMLGGVGYTIGSESSDTINVTVQLEDTSGSDLGQRACLTFFFSDNASGDTIHKPDTSLAIGTDGILAEWTSDTSGMMCSESDGDIDVDVGESADEDLYLCTVLPTTGESSCSAKIDFD